MLRRPKCVYKMLTLYFSSFFETNVDQKENDLRFSDRA